MKQKNLLTTMLLLFALIVGSMNAWAQTDSYSIVFNSTDGSDATAAVTSISDIVASGDSYITSITDCEKIYRGKSGYGVKLGSSSVLGKFTINLSTTGQVNATKITFNACRFGSDTSNLKVTINGDTEHTFTLTTDLADYDYEFNSATAITSIKIEGVTKRIYVKSLTVTYSTGSTPSTTPIATIGDLNPTEVNLGDIDDFALDITPADGTTEGTDYIVVWESSDDEILELVDNTYEAKAAGTVTVTVTVTPDDTDTYNEVSRQFTVTVIDPNGPGTENNPYTVAQARAAIDAGTGVTGAYVKGIVTESTKTYNSQNGWISYYISDDGTKTSGELQAYKGKSINGADFTSENDILVGDEVVIYGNLQYYSVYELAENNQLVSRIRKTDSELSFGATTAFSCDLMLTFTAPELTHAAGFDGTISYESSNTAVAEVNATSGAVTLKGKGTATITASTEGTATYKAGSASYTITVTTNPGVDPVGPATVGKYVKVTNDADLEEGQYLIVYEEGELAFDGSLTTLDAESNYISVTFDGDDITATDDTEAAEFTLDYSTDESAWTIHSASQYYIGRTSDANGMNTSGNALYNSISIDGGNADISAGGAHLRYNSTSGQTRFRYFKSATYTAQKAIQLYKKEAGDPANTFDVTIGATGYKTLVSTADFTTREGTTAYIVTQAKQSGITLTKVNKVPANEPVILKGTANTTVTLDVTDNASVSGNLLKVSTASTGSGVYVLANGDDGVGFYEWTGGSLGAGRVYLDAPTAARAFLAFIFDEDATGIVEMQTVKNVSNGKFYNLNGQQVAQPTKGLYIVNGKKYIVK